MLESSYQIRPLSNMIMADLAYRSVSFIACIIKILRSKLLNMDEVLEIQNIFSNEPIVPQDEYELKYLLNLLNKIPTYMKRIDELAIKVREFSELASSSRGVNAIKYQSYEIEKMIFRAFFVELENKPFINITDETMSRLKANFIHEGIIPSRNKSCEICKENRSTDRCHILPARLGGTGEINNLLILCPTHHRLFDRFMLSRSEYASIHWESKSKPSQIYADEVILDAHKKFWDNLEHGKFHKVASYDIDSNAKPLIKYILSQLLILYSEKDFFKRSSIYKFIDPNLLSMLKTIINYLLKVGMLRRSKNNFLVIAKSKFKINDKIVMDIWKML